MWPAPLRTLNIVLDRLVNVSPPTLLIVPPSRTPPLPRPRVVSRVRFRVLVLLVELLSALPAPTVRTPSVTSLDMIRPLVSDILASFRVRLPTRVADASFRQITFVFPTVLTVTLNILARKHAVTDRRLHFTSRNTLDEPWESPQSLLSPKHKETPKNFGLY